jgi:hypothetical protein
MWPVDVADRCPITADYLERARAASACIHATVQYGRIVSKICIEEASLSKTLQVRAHGNCIQASMLLQKHTNLTAFLVLILIQQELLFIARDSLHHLGMQYREVTELQEQQQSPPLSWAKHQRRNDSNGLAAPSQRKVPENFPHGADPAESFSAGNHRTQS